jgi:hypothetical protein
MIYNKEKIMNKLNINQFIRYELIPDFFEDENKLD